MNAFETLDCSGAVDVEQNDQLRTFILLRHGLAVSSVRAEEFAKQQPSYSLSVQR